jgi:hypothetical protein
MSPEINSHWPTPRPSLPTSCFSSPWELWPCSSCSTEPPGRSGPSFSTRLPGWKKRRTPPTPAGCAPTASSRRSPETLVIHSADFAELTRTNGGFTEIFRPEDPDAAESWIRRDAVFSAVRRTFQEDNQFAAGNRCYIRVKVENHTNDYNLFLETAQVLKSLGIVVVNE